MTTLTAPAPSAATPILDDATNALLDAMWAGERSGFSKSRTEERVAEYVQMLDDLNARRITPAKVIGSGYKKPMTLARRWLNQQITENRVALATNGRTLSVNIANARHALRENGGQPMLADHWPTFGLGDTDDTQMAVGCSCGHTTAVLPPADALTAWSVHA